MFGWFRRVLVGVWHYADALARIDELERSIRALELEWSELQDKVGAMMKRHAKRVQDAAAAVEGDVPTRTSSRLERAQRRLELHQRRIHGGTQP